MASVALISSMYEIRRTQAEGRIELQKLLLLGDRDELKLSMEIEVEETLNVSDSKTMRIWAMTMNSVLNTLDVREGDGDLLAISIQALLKGEFFQKNPTDSQRLANLKSKTLKRLQILQHEAKELAVLQSTARRTRFERYVFFYLPWVLAFAMALRLTKVTADHDPWQTKLLAVSVRLSNLMVRSTSTAVSRFLNWMSEKRKH